MAGLTALQFRVTNFRNIEDSGWIPLDRVTALVGRNESGKSALLKALHKFNPATPAPYEAQPEFPRDRFTSEYTEKERIPVCAAEFALQDSFKQLLREKFPDLTLPTKVTVTKYYSHDATYVFDTELDDPSDDPKALLGALIEAQSAAMRIEAPAPEQEEVTQTLRTNLVQQLIAWTDELEGLKTLRSSETASTLGRLRYDVNTKVGPLTAEIIEKLQQAISGALKVAGSKPPKEQLWEEIAKALPVFIYFDNYGMLDSAIDLTRFLEDLKTRPNNPKVRTIRAMFKHVKLSEAEIQRLGRTRAEIARLSNQPVTDEMLAEERQRKELRSIKLNSASNDMTKKFSAWWKQRRHRIRYSADGDFFRIWVADDRRPDVEIELESRSQGFQWFFSFYLVFLVESDEMHKDAILLLDEPGLHLHPTAQQELIALFEELSQKNQLIYTTHSPFLIDGDHLERAIPVIETPDGHSLVKPDFWPEDRDTVFPLQAAAGYAMVESLFRHKKNLLVEGMAEYYYLYALSHVCQALRMAALPDDIYVSPCGGTKYMGIMASLFLGHQVRPAILLDADDAARVRKEALLRELYSGHASMIVSLDNVLGRMECEIEDVLGESALLTQLNSMLSGRLEITVQDRAGGSVVDHITAAAKRLSIDLPQGWKGELARRVAADLARSQPMDVEPDVVDRAAKLFDAIRQRF
ncbi:MAG: ATP-binding protein [Betaproteobacteria bacterium]|nr:ATP-binding protein [Betaproteobacteria bacterium]MDH3436426.1 ATP-binding protein [Betaproteobacteria bacterium]